MKLYAVKQNPEFTQSGKVFAGTRVLAKVVNLKKDSISSGEHKLELELPIELPIDLLEYHAKLVKDSSPVIFYGFEMTGQFTASVKLHIPDGWAMESPTHVALYALTPILMRGVVLPNEIKPLEKKVNKKRKKEKN
jgi:hypothetical protein